jgi:uncharacterized protein YbaA (DUF1428 family)
VCWRNRRAGRIWREHGALDAMPFDGKRMAYGGFKVIVDL